MRKCRRKRQGDAMSCVGAASAVRRWAEEPLAGNRSKGFWQSMGAAFWFVKAFIQYPPLKWGVFGTAKQLLLKHGSFVVFLVGGISIVVDAVHFFFVVAGSLVG